MDSLHVKKIDNEDLMCYIYIVRVHTQTGVPMLSVVVQVWY
jgi:hypothetical protein